MNIAELVMPHVTQDVSLAMHAIARGRFRVSYWALAIGLGLLLPAVLVSLVWVGVISLAWLPLPAVLALTGVWQFDTIWVKAGQVVPLS
jgi:hypothetical protein